MIDPFMGKEPHFIKSLGYELLLTPIDIPIIIISVLVSLDSLEGASNSISKKSFEFYFGSMVEVKDTDGVDSLNI